MQRHRKVALLPLGPMQLTITRANTPSRLNVEVHQDPYDPDSPITVVATIRAVSGRTLAAQSVQLRGLETDYVDSVVEAAVHAYRWHSAGSLAAMMRYKMREARDHARKHEDAPPGRRGGQGGR